MILYYVLSYNATLYYVILNNIEWSIAANYNSIQNDRLLNN